MVNNSNKVGEFQGAFKLACSALQIKNKHFIDYTSINLNAGGAAAASNARAPQMEQHKVFLLFGRR